ncbi:glutaredoxin family protein [Roseateles sp.]|jgi:glutaredoxin|uniref:glutaredoxin family protein n=1 Tax=Roseateles sp. TaxID=1971397 RepID=UPI0037C80B50
MKPLIRLFFKTLRVLLGPLMLLKERLTRPAAIQRAAEKQAEVERQCQSLTLYQFRTCPFCIKVRQEMHRLGLPVEKRDAQHDEVARSELLQATGATKVPCLKITAHNGSIEWLGDSGKIIDYLRQKFPA